MEDYIVEMRHITKRFPGIIANDDVTIQVKRGEVYALLGENGAGKSTLMSMLFGMYEPDMGEILINGEPVKFRSSNDATAHSIGMVHQHFKLVDNYTVAENIVLGVEPMKRTLGIFPSVDLKTANREIAELSKTYGLEVNPTDVIENIPVSVRQRVEILKMLYRKAEILIFDEPTAVLTPQEIEFLLKIIDGLRKSGKTIILITHKIEEIKKIADRCAILYRGRLVKVLDVQSTSSQDMANMMVGREVDFNPTKTPANYRGDVLEVSHLTVQNANKFDVVKDVSFKIRSGEVFAVAGVSGNGQGELADAVSGLMKVYSGSIKLCGQDVTNDSIRQRLESGISYIPEDRQGVGVFLDFTLGDNLAIRKYYKQPFSQGGILHFSEFENYADKLIDRYDIRCGQGRKTSLRSMSGGNQQKAIVAREIEEHAKLIIFVQPTRGLDIGAIENIHKQILAERDRGAAILLISLELDEIMELADTIGVIYNGQMMKIADASTLTSLDVGRYMMGVKEA
ncbi:MAG: ABC transporter ATP-binding protein [Oscillibacter sp.]|jgi:simple sugar transport system ATP-binding protein|nr:ABC transporter ATP-binding protein [Oscillibacter sp.]